MKPTRVLLFSFTALALSAQDFPATDRNADGIITRDEWDGTARAFRSEDSNRDGVLSGTELPRGWRRGGEMSRGTEPQRMSEFNRLDRNNDNVIQRSEWRADMAAFRRYDTDRDGRISMSEYAGDAAGYSSYGEGTRSRTAGQLDRNASGAVEGYEWPYNRELFHQMDANRDSVLTAEELRTMDRATLSQLDKNRNGRLDRDEWPGGFAQFRDLDENRDGRVTANEYFDRGGEWQRRQRFQSWDKNGDGIIQSTEWQTDNQLFHRLDTNRNSQLEWQEFQADQERYLTPRRW